MKQLDAVNIISEIIKKDDAVRAIFLKGSIARNEVDDYADVDLYCIVKDEQAEEFLKRRLNYLNQYRPLIYWSESNFVGPQIVAVYDNGLHFDLYTVTLDNLQKTDEIKVIYDPDNLLANYRSEPLTISKEGIVRIFHGFAFTLLEFEAAYCRNDLLWASCLASCLGESVSLILRYIYDINNAKLGFKRLNRSIDKDIYNKMIDAMNSIGPSHLPVGVIKLTGIVTEMFEKLPPDVSRQINIKFLNFMASKIYKLKGSYPMSVGDFN